METLVEQLKKSCTSLVMDWYTRHPSLERITVHALQLDKEDKPIGSVQADVPEADFKGLIKSSSLAAIDRAVAGYIAGETKLSCTAQEAPEPEEIDE